MKILADLAKFTYTFLILMNQNTDRFAIFNKVNTLTRDNILIFCGLVCKMKLSTIEFVYTFVVY